MFKLSTRQKIAIVVVLIHLIYVFFGFYRDGNIFKGDYCEKQWFSGQVEQPLSSFLFSDIYVYPLATLFNSSDFVDGSRRGLLLVDGTGGPCTFISFNPDFPYSLIFILISSVVYYFLGLIIGVVFEDFKNKLKSIK